MLSPRYLQSNDSDGEALYLPMSTIMVYIPNERSSPAANPIRSNLQTVPVFEDISLFVVV